MNIWASKSANTKDTHVLYGVVSAWMARLPSGLPRKIAQQSCIGLQGLGRANDDAGEIRMAWIDEDVALCGHHRTGYAQHGGLQVQKDTHFRMSQRKTPGLIAASHGSPPSACWTAGWL